MSVLNLVWILRVPDKTKSEPPLIFIMKFVVPHSPQDQTACKKTWIYASSTFQMYNVKEY